MYRSGNISDCAKRGEIEGMGSCTAATEQVRLRVHAEVNYHTHNTTGGAVSSDDRFCGSED